MSLACRICGNPHIFHNTDMGPNMYRCGKDGCPVETVCMGKKWFEYKGLGVKAMMRCFDFYLDASGPVRKVYLDVATAIYTASKGPKGSIREERQ